MQQSRCILRVTVCYSCMHRILPSITITPGTYYSWRHVRCARHDAYHSVLSYSSRMFGIGDGVSFDISHDFLYLHVSIVDDAKFVDSVV